MAIIRKFNLLDTSTDYAQRLELHFNITLICFSDHKFHELHE
jgi:hypothetical protein